MKQNGVILETRNLTKKIGKDLILKDISFSITNGSICGLLGRNGAGKSTFLKLISKMLRPTAGNIFFKGEELSYNHLNFIGSLIEAPALYENLTAEENLRIYTLQLGLKDERIKETLDLVDLTNTMNKRVFEFSLGMKQRLGIAKTLINKPEFLILDEPTNGLDPLGIKLFRNLIHNLSRQGVSILISSHLLKEMEDLIDYVGIMAGGELKYQGKFNTGNNLENLFINVFNSTL